MGISCFARLVPNGCGRWATPGNRRKVEKFPKWVRMSRLSNQTVQRAGASRFAQRRIERHRRRAPVADLHVDVIRFGLHSRLVALPLCNYNSFMRNPIIVALDVPTVEVALKLVEQLAPVSGGFKVGNELFTSAGPDIVRRIRGLGAPVS